MTWPSCSVYLAADVLNADLINMIQAEMVALTEQGYACLLVGDFNGHIGCDDQGVVGNNPDINYKRFLATEMSSWSRRLLRQLVMAGRNGCLMQ